MDHAAFTDRVRRVWGMGDYELVARLLAPASAVLAQECAVAGGQEVLDAAAGTGNLALVAAAQGASVTACDLSPVMVERGRARTAEQAFEVDWVEADVEELPFSDSAFDCALSVFGAVFAPRPAVVAEQLFRVVRPGGTVGFTAWPPDSFSGQMLGELRKHLPQAEGMDPPEQWGVEDVARERLAPHAEDVVFERRSMTFEADSVEALALIFESAPGGVAAREALDPERHAELGRGMRAQMAEANEADGGSARVQADYALVVARRAG